MPDPTGPGLPLVALALGDPAGIGPEIALKAALDGRVRAICRPVLSLITPERIARVLDETGRALRRLGVARPRVAVCGLNPHAGEHGMFGTEEMEVIGPAVAAARARGMDVEGPSGADTMFGKLGYDAFVVMLHDQGHLAAKLLATNRIAGMAIGTPVVFSSVAHGSALDIAGQNRASPEAVVEALRRVVGVAALPAAA